MTTSSTQLEREVAEAIASGPSRAKLGGVSDTAGLMGIATLVARLLRDETVDWGTPSKPVRISSSGTQVRFILPPRTREASRSDSECIVDLISISPKKLITKATPFAGDGHFDKRFGAAMEQRVRNVLRKLGYGSETRSER